MCGCGNTCYHNYTDSDIFTVDVRTLDVRTVDVRTIDVRTVDVRRVLRPEKDFIGP